MSEPESFLGGAIDIDTVETTFTIGNWGKLYSKQLHKLDARKLN
jgi:hypothetical protein